ncbi:MAG: hypothetical protein AAGF72_08070 [Pseudomonadota bacterium]
MTLCILVAVLSGCGSAERADALPSGNDAETPVDVSSGGDSQPPVFTVEPGATGPLTLEALNVDYDALTFPPSAAERECIDAKIESRLTEIGDPASFDPETSGLFATQTSRKNWQTSDDHVRRILIAQAVVHRSLNDCT